MNAVEFYTLVDSVMSATLADPVLQLAQVIVRFDPLAIESEKHDDEDYGDSDDLRDALYVTRRCFPDLYADAVMALCAGQSEQRIEQYIRDGICAQGIPMDAIEFEGAFAYGIPMPAYGVDPTDPDSLEPHRDQLERLYAVFGITLEGYQLDMPDHVYDVAFAVARSLDEDLREGNPMYDQLYWLLGWAFSMTGNTCVDATWEILAEYEPLDWSPDNVAFAKTIITEADDIMADALAGLALINGHPDLMVVLQNNVQIIYKAVEQQKGKRNKPNVKLKWLD